MKTALILGSTGLVGKNVLKNLIDDNRYDKIVTIVRKPSLFNNHPKIVEIVSEFDANEDLKYIEKIDTIFSCLGTTRKKTPNLSEYRTIEISIPVNYAKVALQKGLERFHYISAVGVNSNSRNFYQKIKSEAQSALSDLSIPHLHIYQPALLVGDRGEKRFLEDLWSKITPFLDKLSGNTKYHSMPVEQLASGMIRIDNEQGFSEKIKIYTYPEIVK